ncbi:ferredoxin [Paludisphaera mucosa]|uniref:Ferredoxin n=1 Tax=Paludisphaera mucosa TaxID=3030827 RepID=A0ABT6FEF5_9BACT|nr:ferredoxin [Paludisphaera mucosa]MDG3005755.1 ferredoxin [Paludisphaera mucosa]
MPSNAPVNAPGPFYVDENCIDCDLCHETAPGLFARNEDEGRSVVVRPPADDAELELYREAAEACPVEAIREDD